MPAPTKEELTANAQLVRVWEAACKIEYPSDEERHFRIAVAKKLGLAFQLKEVRNVVIDPQPPAKK